MGVYEVLTAQIREAFGLSDETYGMPRVGAELRDAGIVANRKRILRLARQEQLRGVSRRRSFCAPPSAMCAIARHQTW